MKLVPIQNIETLFKRFFGSQPKLDQFFFFSTQAMNDLKRKSDLNTDERHTMRIMPLGAGNEVGRSCIVVKFKGKTIMLDCGVHPGYSGHGSLPFFDGIEAEEVDLLLITHFHIDHIAALPHFTEKTNFTGRVFMTHPTKAVMQMMLRDFLRVSNISIDDQIYDDKDLQNCISKIEIIDFHQEKEVNGIKFTPYNAGHVLGACMYLLEIGGVKVLYTGDYSLEDDRHLMAAETPSCSPDVLIVESTYGVQVHQSVVERESRFTGQVEAVVRRGGRCLLPVFALGRTQELLLILDEHWQANPDLHDIPIYFASKLAAKALRVYQTYINMMNDRIRKQISISNPFQFLHISNLKSLQDFDDSGPSVVMASPGMLQSGVSRELFERWCVEKRNACLIPGYVVEGTLAKKILSEPSEITAMDGRLLPLNCTVEYISFSAHADFVGTSGFVEKLKPSNIVLVHGERNEMMRLKTQLLKKMKDRLYQPKIETPANMEELVYEFKGEKMAKAIGSLAEKKPIHGEIISGLLVEHDFHTHVMAPEDLNDYTQLVPSVIGQTQHLPFHQPFEVFLQFVRQLFENVEKVEHVESENQDVMNAKDKVIVCQKVIVAHRPPDRLVLEWTASPVSDMLADSVVAVAMQAQASAASFKVSNHPTAACKHDHSKTEESEEVKQETNESNEPDVKEEVVKEPEVKEEKLENEDLVLVDKNATTSKASNVLDALEELGKEDEEDLKMIVIFRLLQQQYGNVSIDHETKIVSILTANQASATVDLKSLTIECKDEKLQKLIQDSIHHIHSALNPLPML